MITQTDIANKLIAENGTPTMGSIIKEIIEENNITLMEKGVQYYKNNGDIKDRKIYYYDNGTKVVDETAINNRIPHNWHKLLVKQKMGYLVGKPITFSDKETSEDEGGNQVSPNNEFVNEINIVLDESFDDAMNELVKGCSNKGVEWLHVYINEDGVFKYTIIDARQVIPIWETQRQEELDAVIRYYIITVNGEDRIRAEYWTQEDVTYYLEDSGGNLILDTLTVDDPRQSHFYRVKTIGNEKITNGEGWGMVPFIPFKNNEEMLSDLNDYKELVDEYDKNRSDLANNLEEIQDALFVLKNYAGQDLKEFQRNLRYYRALKVDGDGDVKTITIEIPVEAKKEHTDRLAEDIFMFSQGVNVKTDKFGNSPSGVALQFLYAQLDLKCDTLERKHKKSIKKLLEFIAEYFRIVDNIDYDHNVIKITFNRSMITNEAEKIDSAQKSKNVISDETIAANHPWVDDPQKEMEKLESQKNDLYSQRLGQDLSILEDETGGVEL